MRDTLPSPAKEPTPAGVRRERWMLPACGLLILGALGVLHPAWFRLDRISTSGDMFCMFLPAQQFNRAAWRAGSLPLWNPYHFCGTPFLASVHPACFYPPTALIVLAPDAIRGIQLFRLLHVVLFGLLMFCWLRNRYQAHPLAAMASVLTALGGAYLADHQDHLNQLAALAWLPAVFWSYQALLDQAERNFGDPLLRPRFRLFNSLLQIGRRLFIFKRFQAHPRTAGDDSGLGGALLLFGLLLALQILAGHPQNVFYTLLCCLGWLLYWGAGQLSKRRGARAMICALALSLPGLLLGLGLSALQWFPARELVGRTYRAYDDLNYAAQFAITPKELPRLLLPQFFPAAAHEPEHAAYVGVLTLLGVTVFFGVRANWRRRNFLLLGAALLVYLLACGVHGAAFPLLYYIFEPLVRHFRAPPRVLCINLLIFAFIIAQLLHGAIERFGRRGLLGAGIFTAAMLAEWTQYHRGRATNDVAVDGAAQGPVLNEFLAQVPWLSAHSPEEDLPAVLTKHRLLRLMPDDDQFYQGDADWLSAGRPLEPALRALDAGKLNPRRARVFATLRVRRNRLQPNLNSLSGVRNVEGYEEGLAPLLRFGDFIAFYNRNLRRDTPDRELLKLLGVKWVLFEFPARDENYFASLRNLPGLTLDPAHPPAQIAELQDPRGWAQWLDEIPPGLDLTRLDGPVYLSKGVFAPQLPINQFEVNWSAGDPARPWGLDPAEWNITPDLVREALEAQRGQNSFAPPHELSQPAVNRCRVTWKQPLTRERWLWFSMATYPDWRARAFMPPPASASSPLPNEWRETELRTVNAIGALIRCPAGAAQVEMYYAPDSFRTGLFISLLTLSLCCGWLSWKLSRRYSEQ